MAKLLLYLAESSAVLAFLYLVYILVLRKETFFSLNRFYLIAIVAFSALFPFVEVNLNGRGTDMVSRSVNEISQFRRSYFDALTAWEFSGREVTSDEIQSGSVPSDTNEGSLLNFLLLTVTIVYFSGLAVCFSRTISTIRHMRKLIRSHPRKNIEGITIVRLPYPTAPFSFFRFVFVHDNLIDTPEFDQILAHEKTHVRERHSIDLILVQLLAAVYWFNPVIWRLGKSLKTTHEYIADKKIISSGYSLVEYQTLLLKQLISNNSFGLVHNFNLSFIKNRITMMTNKPSGWTGKAKVAGAIACTIMFSLLIIQCNSKLDEAFDVRDVTASGNLSAGVHLPVLPETSSRFTGDISSAVHITIGGNKLAIEGKECAVGDIATFFEKGKYPPSITVVMKIDKDQSMELVRKVDMELRKADRRKLLYVGQSESGNAVETLLLLPPTPENAAKNGMPLQPDMSKVEAEGSTDILKIDLGEPGRAAYQQQVYDFVKAHANNKNMLYVVSARFDDDDNFDDYLSNLVYVKEGFYQLYEERAQEMFGKDFVSLGKEEHAAARVPMNISIAEKD